MHGDPLSCGRAPGLLAEALTPVKSEAETKEKDAAHLGADEMQRRGGGPRLPKVLGKQHPLSLLAGSLCSGAEQQQPTAWRALEKVQHAQPEASGWSWASWLMLLLTLTTNT